MHLILLSGGSGKRLWPLSNSIRAKQFLRVLPNPHGTVESMAQRTYRQLEEAGGWESITVVANSSQRDQLEMQLGKRINIVIEPERRDTFPAIVLACAYLHSELGVKDDEHIAVLPVDSFVRPEYFKAITRLPEALNAMGDGLALMGISPSFPSEKYGYIVPADVGKDISDVRYFKEKPDRDTAEALISEGALWNGGVFGFRMKYIRGILGEKFEIADFSFDNVLNEFGNLKKVSFDYEVVERANQIKVIKYGGEWKDLGTWETFTEEMASAVMGSVLLDDTCRDTHAVNELGIPMVLMGLKNAVAVASRDGILIAEKGRTHKLKEITGSINIRPMCEEKRWGEYVVIEHTEYDDGTEALTKKLYLHKGQQISYQYHQKRKEIWTILRGEGIVYVDGVKRAVGAGDVIKIEEKQRHGISAASELEIIEVQLGKPLIEDDIVRLEMDW